MGLHLARTLLPMLLAALVLLSSHTARAQQASIASPEAAALQNRMRDLWTAHLFWVRELVQHTAQGRPRAAEVAEHWAERTARQIAALHEPFYGDDVSGRIAALLTEQTEALGAYMRATVAAEPEAIERAGQRVLAISVALGRLFGEANPTLLSGNVRGLFAALAGYHTSQIQQLLVGNYVEEAETWMLMREHIQATADALALALVQQYPERFAVLAQP